MNGIHSDDTASFKVVVNDEDQYSIWPALRSNPPGWYDTGVSGPKPVCLAHIDSVWVDMRPRSLCEAMGGEAAKFDDLGDDDANR